MIASMCQRGELDPIPRTQHRPITITIRSPVTATHFPFRRRFTLKKDNWSNFTKAIANIPAHPNHYNDFVDLVKTAARHNIPRGCQKEYIPGLSDESSDLLKLYDEEYNKDPFSESTIQLGDTSLDELSGERRKIWRDKVENTNLIMNSKKAWATIRRLGADNVSPSWSLLSLLTKSLTNYFLMEEEWNTEGHPVSNTQQSFKVTTSHQLSLLSLSAWTNSQLASAC